MANAEWDPQRLQNDALADAARFSRTFNIGREFGFDIEQLVEFNMQFARYLALKLAGKAHPALLGKFTSKAARELEEIVHALDTTAGDIGEIIDHQREGDVRIYIDVSPSVRSKVSSMINLDSRSPMDSDAIQRAANLLSSVSTENTDKPKAELQNLIRKTVEQIKLREMPQNPSVDKK